MGKMFVNLLWHCKRHWRPCDVEPRQQEESWSCRYLLQLWQWQWWGWRVGVPLERGWFFFTAAFSSKSHIHSTLKLSGWASGLCKIVPDRWSKQKHTSTRGELSSVSLSPFTMYMLEANEIVTTAGNKWGTAHERPWGHHVSWHSRSTCKPVISS